MEINGIEYKERQRKVIPNGGMFGKIMLMAQMYGGINTPKGKDLGVNIIAEFNNPRKEIITIKSR